MGTKCKMTANRNPIKLWIDDKRPPPDTGWVWATTCSEAVAAINRFQLDAVSFDHDLGEGRTGYDVACAVEQMAWHGDIGRFAWDVHSANPVGADRIAVAMKKAEAFWSEKEKGV